MKINQIGEFTNAYVHLQLKNNPENKAKAMQVSKRDYFSASLNFETSFA